MDTRFGVRLAFVAAAFSVLAALPVAAADDCKDKVTAEGKPAAMRDLGAYPNSLFAWRSAVKDKYGGEYTSIFAPTFSPPAESTRPSGKRSAMAW